MKTQIKIPKNQIARLRKRVKRYGDEAIQEIRDELDAAGINIESEAKNNINRDGHVDTARLITSIHWESKGNRGYTYEDKFGNTFDGSFEQAIDDMTIIAGSNVEYAPKIEDLDAFLYPAWEKERANFLARLKNLL